MLDSELWQLDLGLWGLDYYFWYTTWVYSLFYTGYLAYCLTGRGSEDDWLGDWDLLVGLLDLREEQQDSGISVGTQDFGVDLMAERDFESEWEPRDFAPWCV